MMKITALLATFLLSLSMVFAQEYTIKYDLSMQSDDPQVQAQLSMMQGSTLTIYVKDDMSRTESDMGGFITTTNIIDTKKGKGIMLMDGMMGKTASPFDLKDLKSKEGEEKGEFEFTDETKEILGHLCKKAIMYIGDDAEFTYWYTEDIKINPEAMGKYVKEGLPGLPLEYTIEQENTTIHFTANDISDKVKATKGMFSTKVPKGYTEKSIDDILNITGAK